MYIKQGKGERRALLQALLGKGKRQAGGKNWPQGGRSCSFSDVLRCSFWPWGASLQRALHPAPVITQHRLRTAAFKSSQKSRFRGNGNNTNANCSRLNCLWTFRHHQSQKYSVFMAKITHSVLTLGEGRGSSKEILFWFEGKSQP